MSQQFFVDNEELLIHLIDYFEETWIVRPTRRNIRRPPIFDLKLWNQYDATQAGLPKTNNYIEGWHRAFSSLLAAAHPTIWQLIEVLKKEQHLTEVKINQFIAGQEPSAKKEKYRDIARRIENITYDERDLDEYLIGIAHHLELQY